MIARTAQAPIAEVRSVSRLATIAHLPLPFRRLLMWLAPSLGRQRANYVGTFAVSSVSFLGSDIHTLRSIWMTLLNYGVLDGDGGVDVRIVLDHRAVDGATIARALAQLESVLTGPIRRALRDRTDGQPR